MQIQRGSGGLSVVEMPEELRKPMSDAVMEFLVDEGMAKRK